MRVKRTYHADPKNAQWTAQGDPADPRETKTILKKKEKKILDEPLQDEAAQSTPTAWPHQRDFEFNFRFNSGQCFHLRTMFSPHGHIPTQTSTTLPAAGCVGLCLCQ